MKKYISIIAVVLAAGISGCKKDYLDQEVNPDAPSVSTPSLTLSAALVTSAAIVQGGDYSFYGVWDGYWTTSGSYVPSQTINEFQFTNTDFNGSWTDLYSNLTNYNTLQNISSGSANANFAAIAIIMKAYDFEQLVDNYNDVPYTQAFQPSTILFPAYDKAEDIYHDLGKKLDAAIALIKANPGALTPGSADVAFNGNMTDWIKFANTIKLRLAIRVYKKLGLSDALVTDLASTAGDGYLDGTVEATVNPGYANSLAGSGAFQANPFWATYGSDVNGNPTFPAVYYLGNAYAIKLLANTNDPRDTSFYGPVPSDTTVVLKGNVFGDTKTTLSGANTSPIGPGLLQSATQNAVLLSGAESLFLQAEAAYAGLPGFTAGNAETLYDAGVTASFEESKAGGKFVYNKNQTFQYGHFQHTAASTATSDALAAAYLAQPLPNVKWSSSTNKLQAIITQKWIALNGYFVFEAYNEYRRTGYPALPASIDPSAINSGNLPTRIFYPLSELASNSTNLAAAIKSEYGVPNINPFTQKIFWAQ